jgi:hypothetical protein
MTDNIRAFLAGCVMWPTFFYLVFRVGAGW